MRRYRLPDAHEDWETVLESLRLRAVMIDRLTKKVIRLEKTNKRLATENASLLRDLDKLGTRKSA